MNIVFIENNNKYEIDKYFSRKHVKDLEKLIDEHMKYVALSYAITIII